MRTISEYTNWVLPTILKNSEWKVYIEAVLGEIVNLQKYNMGSYNEAGFNGVEEDINFDTIEDWIICKSFNPYKGIYSTTTEGWELINSEVCYTGESLLNTFLVINYAVMLGKTYTVKFTLYDITSTLGATLSIGIGQLDQYQLAIDIGTSDPLEVEIELEAIDYWLYFGVSTGDNGVDFKIKDLVVTGIEETEDNTQLWLVLKRTVAIDNASRYILEKMRDSYSFPSIANMPEELLRQLIKDFNIFIGYGGAELASIMFFYFLGYAADFVHLYAHTGDYESKSYSYIAQKEDDLLISDTGDTVYGQVKTAAFSTSVLKLKDGHQIIDGDEISNQTNPFASGLITVIGIDGNYVYLDEPVTVAVDDLIDVYRVYPYAVNPDPDDYYKTSHIDVYFKQKYLSGVDISFASLEAFFTQYLPINVVIRFFGYSDTIPDETFKFKEPLFKVSTVYDEVIAIEEEETFPVDDHAFVVQNSTPRTHKDRLGNDVDGYSYLITGYDPDGVTPKYVVIPHP